MEDWVGKGEHLCVDHLNYHDQTAVRDVGPSYFHQTSGLHREVDWLVEHLTDHPTRQTNYFDLAWMVGHVLPAALSYCLGRHPFGSVVAPSSDGGLPTLLLALLLPLGGQVGEAERSSIDVGWVMKRDRLRAEHSNYLDQTAIQDVGQSWGDQTSDLDQ
jgi:hypothetical protein